jgi:adenosylcobinamide kinase/adenosylcobinamide-phosphate guanylyltransferase
MRTLILGGVRSGKSRAAAQCARTAGGAVTLIATATALDAEMAARIASHRNTRPSDWQLIEEPLALGAALARAGAPGRTVIVDCLTLWLTNLLLHEDRERLERERAALLEAVAAHRGELVLVSNEVGFGIIPANALARRFGDEAGTLHQQLAALCERVHFMVAGIAMVVRDTAPARVSA